jgi:hypothetical protein
VREHGLAWRRRTATCPRSRRAGHICPSWRSTSPAPRRAWRRACGLLHRRAGGAGVADAAIRGTTWMAALPWPRSRRGGSMTAPRRWCWRESGRRRPRGTRGACAGGRTLRRPAGVHLWFPPARAVACRCMRRGSPAGAVTWRRVRRTGRWPAPRRGSRRARGRTRAWGRADRRARARLGVLNGLLQAAPEPAAAGRTVTASRVKLEDTEDHGQRDDLGWDRRALRPSGANGRSARWPRTWSAIRRRSTRATRRRARSCRHRHLAIDRDRRMLAGGPGVKSPSCWHERPGPAAHAGPAPLTAAGWEPFASA